MAAAIITAGSDDTVTIPRVWMDYLRVRPQDEVEIDSVEGGIVIRSLSHGDKPPRRTFAQIIEDFERVHGPTPAYEWPELDWGPDVGAERWWETE